MAIPNPQWLQTKTYIARDLRSAFLELAIQEGVHSALDLLVTQRGAGANMSVDVALGVAWVRGDTITRQGMYRVYADAASNVAVTSNASGNPRLDQVIFRAYDSTDGGAGQDAGAIEVIAGTGTAGATLDNRNGAAALPATAVRLADIIVANGAASIVTANIRDRRPWATGAMTVERGTGAGDYSTTSTSFVAVDATNLGCRLECSGAPLRVSVQGIISGSTGLNYHALYVDGAAATEIMQHRPGSTVQAEAFHDEWLLTPAAGSHTFELRFRHETGGANSTIIHNSSAAVRPVMVFEELVNRPNFANG